MKRKQPYKAPAILREVCLQLEEELLVGSVIDKTDITSVGQTVDEYDFSKEGFNHTWED